MCSKEKGKSVSENIKTLSKENAELHRYLQFTIPKHLSIYHLKEKGRHLNCLKWTNENI
jgi:hypothetical protein